MTATRTRQVSRYLEKYVLNPQLRLALRLNLAPGTFALLETTGRRTGRCRQTPVGNGLDDDGPARRHAINLTHGASGRID